MRDVVFHIFFVWYPYVCLSAFVFGSIIRFDREQYTWRAGSSQLLRRRQLTWGSNLFHVGILFLLIGHTVGLLTPEFFYTKVMTPAKKMLAIIAGGIAGTMCFIAHYAVTQAPARFAHPPDFDLHGSRHTDHPVGPAQPWTDHTAVFA